MSWLISISIDSIRVNRVATGFTTAATTAGTARLLAVLIDLAKREDCRRENRPPMFACEQSFGGQC